MYLAGVKVGFNETFSETRPVRPVNFSLPSNVTYAFKFPLPGADMAYDRAVGTARSEVYREERMMKQVTHHSAQRA